MSLSMRLVALDNLLENWNTENTPRVSPEEYAKYRDLAFRNYVQGNLFFFPYKTIPKFRKLLSCGL